MLFDRLESMNHEEFNAVLYKMTPTQNEVLRKLLAGETDEAISRTLLCTKDNVRKHVSNIGKIFGLKNREGEHYRYRYDLICLFAEHKSEWVNPKLLDCHVHQTVPELEYPDGFVPLGSPFYVERPPLVESRCYEAIVKPGSLIRIKAPKLMGKTSLMARIVNYAVTQGYKTVYLDLSSVELGVRTSLDKFLRWLCERVSRQMKLENQLDDYWDEGILSKTSNCTDYFEEYLLTEIDCPLVLALDEVDQIFSYPQVAEDFLGMLRSWHEKWKLNDLWKRLRLIVAHSTEVYIPLNINKSPFNVGVPVELPEFTHAQVQDLARLHQLNWNEVQVKQLMAMVGGHPYLVRLAMYNISHKKTTLEQLLQDAPTEAGIYSNHLRRHWENLQKDPELFLALQKVVMSPTLVVLERVQSYKLHSMGLVNLQGNQVEPSCDLYQKYFSK